MIPSTWYPLKYSTHAATKTPVVERISEKESALYALNASDFKFSPARLYHQVKNNFAIIPTIKAEAVHIEK